MRLCSPILHLSRTLFHLVSTVLGSHLKAIMVQFRAAVTSFKLTDYTDATILRTSGSCYQTVTKATLQLLTNVRNKPLDLVHFSLEDMSKRVWNTSHFFLLRISHSVSHTCVKDTEHLSFVVYCEVALHVHEGTHLSLTATHCVKCICCVTLFVVYYPAQMQLYTFHFFINSTGIPMDIKHFLKSVSCWHECQ